MYQIFLSLGYYGIKKTPKTNKWQGMQLSPMNTTRLEVAGRNRYAMACQIWKETSNKDVYIKVSSSYCINWGQENKNIELYLDNMGAERYESGWDWCYARGKIHIEFT